MTGREALRVVYPLSTWQVRELLASTKDATLRLVCEWALEPGPGFGEVIEAAGIGPARRQALSGRWPGNRPVPYR